MDIWRTLKIAGVTLAAVAAAGAVAALLVRDQMDRHQRNLFSPDPRKRLACLGHMARSEATVEDINLLRDFLAWEPKKLLRNRARVILRRMEDQALDPTTENSLSQR
ncbi:MAG: hypothetical protein ACWGSQ_11600 [Longimicrobiales bacterium]